jgi:hypothetical protein
MLVLCGLAIAVRPWVARLAENARLWWFVAIGNRGAMTLYLWHLMALMMIFGVSHLLGHDRSDRFQPGFWWLVAAQVLALWVLTSVLFFLLQALENTPIPWWDAPLTPLSTSRAALAWVGLAAITLTNLMSSLYGFLDAGVFWVPAFVASLLLTRAIMPTRARTANRRKTTAQESAAGASRQAYE